MLSIKDSVVGGFPPGSARLSPPLKIPNFSAHLSANKSTNNSKLKTIYGQNLQHVEGGRHWKKKKKNTVVSQTLGPN